MTDEIDLNIDKPEDNNFECESCEALKVISDLKNFASENYIAFQHIKNLEDYFQSCFLKRKISNMRQSSILEFVNK